MHTWRTCSHPGCHRLLTSLETLSEGLCDDHILERDLDLLSDFWEQRTGGRLNVAELRQAIEREQK